MDSTSKILVTEANPWGPIGASKQIGEASTLFRDMEMAWKDELTWKNMAERAGGGAACTPYHEGAHE